MSELDETSASELAGLIGATAEAAITTSDGLLRRIGVDVVDLPAFERQIAVAGDRFLGHLLTSDEIDYCQGRLERLATRVAAKEAAVKVLGSGFRGVRWNDIEVSASSNGAPSIRLTGAAAEVASRSGLNSIEVSCSHEHRFAVAVAVGLSHSELKGRVDSRQEVMGA